MAPSFAVGAVGFDAIQALILSQVALSLILPVPMIALLVLTRSADVMGSYANGRLTMAAATAAAAIAWTTPPFGPIALWASETGPTQRCFLRDAPLFVAARQSRPVISCKSW